jgi:CheY-like chemotaxis protein
MERSKRMTDLGRITATIAHEINNILMGIQPFADIIRRKAAGSADLTAAAQHIGRAVLRGRRVTHEILRFARPAQPQLTVFDCHELLGAATRELRPVLPDTIELVVRSVAGCGIRADRDQLTQVLTNLVLNARDAMPDGGTIKLEAAHVDARTVEISVSDTGRGMPPDVLAQIFDPLFTTKPNGTGLGLSIVHQIIAAHGGRITAESSVGRGSTFRIRLPIASMEGARPEPPKTVGGRLPVRRILLADDEAEVAAGLSILLEQEGCEVSTVHYGRDVEPEIERFRPDVLILDLRFPDIRGDVIYERVARRWPDLPTVFSTGETEIADLERFLGRPHIAYVRKPYEFSDLVAALRIIVTPPALRS